MSIDIPQGDLARAVVHEPNRAWPTMIEITAYWKPDAGKRGKRRIVRISAAEFFGSATGAPMTGDQLIGIIERLRKA